MHFALFGIESKNSNATVQPETDTHNPTFDNAPRTRAVCTALLLVLLMPVSIVLSIVAWVCGFGHPPKTAPNGVTVLVTGGKMSKSLHMARWFWRSGYRVVMVETPKYWHVGARFSRSVAAFHIVPDPRVDPEGYVRGLARVAALERARYFVPVSSPAAAISDAAARDALSHAGCEALHFDLPTCELLDNKHRFCAWARDELGLRAPESVLLPSDDAARALNERLQGTTTRYVLKNLQYDSQHRLDLFTLPCARATLDAYLATLTGEFALTPSAPWQAQRFLVGPEYTAFAVLRAGAVRALTVSASSASQLNYEHVAAPQIEEWVARFAKRTQLTGMLCWDFIHDEAEDAPYPIECNPRVHTQSSCFLEDDAFGAAVLAPTPPPLQQQHDDGIRRPPSSSTPVYWLWNEVFKLLFPAHYGCSPGGARAFAAMLATQRDAQLDGADPLPFIVANHVQLPLLLARNVWRGNPWKKCDFAIGKIVEVNGD
jgi:hypothetical protein